MNDEKRKTVSRILKEMKALKHNFEKVQWELEDLRAEEEMSLDNLPENLQTSQTAENLEQSAEVLGDAADHVDSCLENIDEAIVELESI